MKVNVLSERAYRRWPSFDVVFEWEDIIAQVLNAQIITFESGVVGKVVRWIKKYWLKVNKSANSSFKIANTLSPVSLAAPGHAPIPPPKIVPVI